MARQGRVFEPVYCRSRQEAEARLQEIFAVERAAGRRVLAGFDFPFGYPARVARAITGSDDPLALWQWLEARIEDQEDGSNNRFEVAEEMNRAFDGLGPFWGKPAEAGHPDLPYRKAGIVYDRVAERRQADLAARASSSCFQLYFNPTVGSQALMGLPMLARLRRTLGAAIWPFEQVDVADIVIAEIWPGLIEPAVKAAAGPGEIRDRAQVRLLAKAFAALPPGDLSEALNAAPEIARQEAWILGTEIRERLTVLAQGGLEPPPLRDDCFSLPAGVDWTPVDEAMDRLNEALAPVVGTHEVAVSELEGRVLGKDIRALRPNPPKPNAAVDGYGFAFESLSAPPHTLPLAPGRAAAGLPYEGAVPARQALRILTGAALPDGVDTVVLEEDCSTDGASIAFREGIKPGANTRKAGEDFAPGDTVLRAGARLRAPDLALLAASGQALAQVRRPLRVAVLSTGDELIDAGEEAQAQAQPHSVIDANRPMLCALVRSWGHELLDLGIVPDDAARVRDAMSGAARDADAIITSGGASAGDEDHISALLSREGQVTSWRIALKPGRPLALAMYGGTPVFGLPGNPVAALVCALIFARPALSRLAGGAWLEPLVMTVPAAFTKRKKPGRREYLRARLNADGAAEVFASEGSGRISGLSWAEGLVELPDGAAEIAPGDPVRFLPYAGMLA